VKDKTKLLFLISVLWKGKKISMEQKTKLKMLMFDNNPCLLAALEYFEVENDLDELAETFGSICACTPTLT